jgi:hypothetical protein
MMRSVVVKVARFDSYAPTGVDIEARLQSIPVTVLEWILLSDRSA